MPRTHGAPTHFFFCLQTFIRSAIMEVSGETLRGFAFCCRPPQSDRDHIALVQTSARVSPDCVGGQREGFLFEVGDGYMPTVYEVSR